MSKIGFAVSAAVVLALRNLVDSGRYNSIMAQMSGRVPGSGVIGPGIWFTFFAGVPSIVQYTFDKYRMNTLEAENIKLRTQTRIAQQARITRQATRIAQKEARRQARIQAKKEQQAHVQTPPEQPAPKRRRATTNVSKK